MSGIRPRVIPCLQIDERALVKTRRFRDPAYLGDPINAVKLFNDLECDELVVVDISATRRGAGPDFEFVEEFASEAFMPLAYGGGITSMEQIKRLFTIGVEKVIVNSAAPDGRLVAAAAERFGSQSVVVSIDVRTSLFGKYEVYTHSASKGLKSDPVSYAKRMQEAGAGEIFIHSVELEGSGKGFDQKLLASVCDAVAIPVIGCGGAGELAHFRAAFASTAVSGLAAGTMFVMHGKHRAPLISYPAPSEIQGLRSVEQARGS